VLVTLATGVRIAWERFSVPGGVDRSSVGGLQCPPSTTSGARAPVARTVGQSHDAAGGVVLLGWLLFGGLAVPLRGRIALWVVAVAGLGTGAVEVATDAWRTGD